MCYVEDGDALSGSPLGSALRASRIGEMRSSGMGNRMVEFCSLEISERVCRCRRGDQSDSLAV